jgi:uncharacterized protein
MEGSARVFAGEFYQSTLVIPSTEPGSVGWVVTPGGAWCRQMYIAGVLTETVETGDLVRSRLADPTGAFDIVFGGRNGTLTQAFQKIAVPSFVAITGYAQAYQKNGNVLLSVRPDHAQVIDRTCRDMILLSTAEYSLRRFGKIRGIVEGTCTDDRFLRAANHYAITLPKIFELVRMIESAVESVRPREPQPASGQADVCSVVMELMQNSSGPRGIAVEEIIEILALRGLGKDAVLKALESLIQDDECYQPQKGYVKLL